MKFKPVGKYRTARLRGEHDYIAGKSIEDNPYLRQPDKAMSSWWQAGFLAKKNG